MNQDLFEAELGSRILEQIHEGMTAVDREGDELGKVVQVFMGASSERAEEEGEGAATAPDIDVGDEDSFVEDLAEAIAPVDQMPEVLRERLLRHGFIRIDTGLFSEDLYAMPDQIARITTDRVILRVSADELIKP
ncbi:MAG: hypothetical protein M5U01_12330 [Ardenticatenaceae bacterium]|nr:hypothetical protein [Ardenticatenaceae bacterium]HBY93639.1 hypothetical protein [Chloroflexota bacterium]